MRYYKLVLPPILTPHLIIQERPEQHISRILYPFRVTPNRVTIIHLWTQVTLNLVRPTQELRRVTFKRPSIWSCTGWGLPSFPGHPGNWCALTAPFHPYRQYRRYIFCCTFLHVAVTPRYGAPCPVVFGLSSGSIKIRRSPGLLRPVIKNF